MKEQPKELKAWRMNENYLGQCVVAEVESNKIICATGTTDERVVSAVALLVDLHNASLRSPAPGVLLSDGERLTERVTLLEDAIRAALDELGEPGPGYPAPVAEAHRGLCYALMNNTCPPCDIGENTECVCPPKAERKKS